MGKERMDRPLSLGYSPCPNDTFIFYALAHGRMDLDPFAFDISLADVEELNQKARRGELDATKVSIHALLHLLDDYWLLRAGGAMGRGCGPLVVARGDFTMEDLRKKPIAIPGSLTTANLLLKVHGLHQGPCIEMVFDRIMPAIAAGEVEAGVIIHEGRFTYPSYGLKLVLDLGQWWENHTGLSLPLGGILMKRNLGPHKAQFLEEKIRESIVYARNHPEEAWPYIRSHAQEMEADVIRRHIDMFVNDFTLDMGREGEDAIRYMIQAAGRNADIPVPAKPVFWNSQS